jgi:hypothetical protein
MREIIWSALVLSLLCFPAVVMGQDTRFLTSAVTLALHSRVEVQALPTPTVSANTPQKPHRGRRRSFPEKTRAWKDVLQQQSDTLAATPGIGGIHANDRPTNSRAVSSVFGFEGPSNAENTTLIGFGVLPPDSNIGAGPNHLFQVVNSIGKISTKTGTLVSSFTLRSFFGLDASTDETDPRVLFDIRSQRWFATYVQFSTTASTIVLAVSTSSDPTGTFCRYRLGNPTSESFQFDFPQLGVSDDKIVVAYDAFSFSGISLGAGYFVVNKADLIGCAAMPHVVRVPPDPSRHTEFPAQALSSSSPVFLAMSDGDMLNVFAVNGIPGVTPVMETRTSVPVRLWIVPPNAPQLGSGVLLDTGDDAVLSAAWRANSLWLAGNEGCVPPGDIVMRSCLRVIEVRTDSLSVRQDMSFGLAGAYYYYPALAPDAFGNVAIVFTSSSAARYASVAVTGRYSGSLLNTLEEATTIRAGNGAQTSSTARMGDYSGASVDPLDSISIWVMGEYIRSRGESNWGTYVGRLVFDPPPLAAAVLPSGRSVQIGVPATTFATIINAGPSTARAVGITLSATIPATLTYQTTDSSTNALTGTPNTPVDIPSGQRQSFVIAVTPTSSFAPQDVAFVFEGADTPPATLFYAVNTLLLSASSRPVPDIVAIASTTSNDGLVAIPGPGASAAFAVAAVNVGTGAMITASVDTGGLSVPVNVALCETNPRDAQCVSAIGASVTTLMLEGATPTFSIFVTADATIPLDPANNRVSVVFTDAGGVVRGRTSVAVVTR